MFQTVDFALNPMLSGSGTNLKMFDYMAAGIPVFSTRFGTRGIAEKEHFILAETEDEFVERIRSFSLESEETRARVEAARRYVENTFDWAVVSTCFADEIEKRLRKNNPDCSAGCKQIKTRERYEA